MEYAKSRAVWGHGPQRSGRGLGRGSDRQTPSSAVGAQDRLHGPEGSLSWGASQTPARYSEWYSTRRSVAGAAPVTPDPLSNRSQRSLARLSDCCHDCRGVPCVDSVSDGSTGTSPTPDKTRMPPPAGSGPVLTLDLSLVAGADLVDAVEQYSPPVHRIATHFATGRDAAIPWPRTHHGAFCPCGRCDRSAPPGSRSRFRVRPAARRCGRVGSLPGPGEGAGPPLSPSSCFGVCSPWTRSRGSGSCGRPA
jgi:hypothetical protein